MDSILQVNSLSKHFGNKQVLKDVNLIVPRGSIVGLIGPNGAGKTTIMKAILGLFSYEKGMIKINNELVTGTSHQALAKVGALIEYPAIYPYLTGYQHLELNATGDNRKQRITKIAQQLQMTEYLNRKAKNYSLGMKQKLGLALALINQPELVILDEPMNGLDPQATKDLREVILSEAAKGTSFLISSHILGELEKIVSEVIIIDNGEVVKQAPITKLRMQRAEYIVLKTNDDQRARTLLLADNIPLIEDERVIFDRHVVSLSRILKKLILADIEVEDVLHQDNDLEASLLSILNHEKAETR